MIYLSDIKQSSYVYTLMCTKCLLNLCIHMYTCRSLSFSDLQDIYRVYNKKTINIESVREILESKQQSVSDSINAVTGHMNEPSDHKVRSDPRPTLTKSQSTKTVDKESVNVDGGQIGEETC